MKSYSMDLRQRVVAACDAGQSTLVVARTFGVSAAWVRRLKQHRRERGDIVPRSGGGVREGQRKIDGTRAWPNWCASGPTRRWRELRERLGVACTRWSICRALHRLGHSHKKSRSSPPSRTGPTSPPPPPPPPAPRGG